MCLHLAAGQVPRLPAKVTSWQMVGRSLGWPDTPFCPHPSAAPIVLPVEVGLGPVSCFCMSLGRMIVDSINKEYFFVMTFVICLPALHCWSSLGNPQIARPCPPYSVSLPKSDLGERSPSQPMAHEACQNLDETDSERSDMVDSSLVDILAAVNYP